MSEKSPFAHRLVPLFQDWGVSMLTLHGRSKEQRYTKLADYDYIKKCSSEINPNHSNQMQFFGNGDILNPCEYFDALRKNDKLDGILIGRGALIKPWIFDEIKNNKLYDISSKERLDILKDFCKFGIEHWGSDTMVNN